MAKEKQEAQESPVQTNASDDTINAAKVADYERQTTQEQREADNEPVTFKTAAGTRVTAPKRVADVLKA